MVDRYRIVRWGDTYYVEKKGLFWWSYCLDTPYGLPLAFETEEDAEKQISAWRIGKQIVREFV